MYDPKCLELAKHFLTEFNAHYLATDLAQALQDTVDDFMRGYDEQRTSKTEVQNGTTV